jgi:hypothetical protein
MTIRGSDTHRRYPACRAVVVLDRAAQVAGPSAAAMAGVMAQQVTSASASRASHRTPIRAEFDHLPSDAEGLRMSTTGQPH